MGNEDHAPSGIDQRTHDRKKFQNLTWRQHRSRLVKHHNFRLAHEHFDDLHALTHTHRQILDYRIGVELKVVLVRHFTHHPARFFDIERPETPCGLHTEHDVFCNGHDGHQHEVLVHHSDACGNRVGWRRKMRGFPIDQELALVRVIQPVQHIHEGAFAGAVLANQGQHLACGNRQVHIVIGDDTRKSLGDAP